MLDETVDNGVYTDDFYHFKGIIGIAMLVSGELANVMAVTDIKVSLLQKPFLFVSYCFFRLSFSGPCVQRDALPLAGEADGVLPEEAFRVCRYLHPHNQHGLLQLS